MKKILYITNIEVPYKVRLFNELAKRSNLTVLYERKRSKNRDASWTCSEPIKYHIEYINGFAVGNEYSFSFKILKYVFSKYDSIIISCYNSPVQMLAIVVMRLLRIPYVLSVDGEPFLEKNSIKARIKKFFLHGATKYLAAGQKSADSLAKVTNEIPVVPYYFSSIYKTEMNEHLCKAKLQKRNKTVLVVGQYFDYKGMDIMLEVARKNTTIKYKFVGMGKRTEKFIKEKQADRDKNVEIIPFLQKEELEKEYISCAMLVLPSRQECWGLVINEAASFGMPIVSTWGSGAAVEFLSDNYEEFLAKPGDVDSLYDAVQALFQYSEISEYSEFLIQKSQEYSIQHMVEAHCKILEIN